MTMRGTLKRAVQARLDQDYGRGACAAGEILHAAGIEEDMEQPEVVRRLKAELERRGLPVKPPRFTGWRALVENKLATRGRMRYLLMDRRTRTPRAVADTHPPPASTPC